MAGKIFINYRRGDDPGFAGRLFDRLEEAFTADRIFIDIDNIEPGLDFVRVLEDQVDRCDVLLAVIGPNWLTAKDENGARRIDNPNDFVRIEIESGLKLGKRIIPVLVNNADMPRTEHLPESLQPLSRRNAVRLTHERFRADAQGLVKQLEKALLDAEAARKAAVTAAEEEAKRRAEDEAAKAAEAARQEKEKARLDAVAGLSAEQIAKAEELANWDFIKDSKEEPDYRDHLARFPQGVTLRMARTRLETILWGKLGFTPTAEALEGFLAEFPDGARAAEAAKTLAKLKAKTAEKPRAPRAPVRKKAEPAPAALKAEPAQAQTEDSAAVPVTTRKRWIGLVATAAVYGFLAVVPSGLAFGTAGFVIAALAGVALLWWFFAPVRSVETQAAAAVVSVDDELRWPAWAYATLIVAPLLFAFTQLSNEMPSQSLLDALVYLLLGTLVATAALAFAQRKTLSGTEIGLYWLGGALTALNALLLNWKSSGQEASLLGLAAMLGLAVVSAVGLLYWRRGRSTPVEISLYWLGSVLTFSLLAKAQFIASAWNLLGAVDPFLGIRAAGLLFGLVVAVVTAFVLARYREAGTPYGSEVGVYWLGCVVLLPTAFGWLFQAYEWNWFSTNWEDQVASGTLAALIVAGLSAAILVYARRPALGALEIACYWLGLTLSALFVFGGWRALVVPEQISGQRTVLGIAAGVAALLAYWWSRRPVPIAHRSYGESSAWQRSGLAPAEPRERRDTAADAAPAEALGWPTWAYAALAIVPLLYAFVLYAIELGTFEPLTTLLFYVCLAALIAGAALALARLTRLSGAEVGLYWLGTALGGALAVMLHAFQKGWTWTLVSSEGGGFIVLLALIVLTAAGMAYFRRGRLSTADISLYWLGSVLWLGLTAKTLGLNAQWNLLGATDIYAANRASGLLLALAIAVASALALLFSRKSATPRGSEVGVYWLGCVLIALQFIPWLFDANEWSWYGESTAPNQLASGLLAGFIVAAISAAVLVYRRRSALRALELGCYWAGLTIAALAAFALNLYTGVVWSARELMILFIALTAAGAIAYWWNRPTLAGVDDTGLAVWRDPGARVGLIIAALMLALIVIFWFFASPPAPA